MGETDVTRSQPLLQEAINYYEEFEKGVILSFRAGFDYKIEILAVSSRRRSTARYRISREQPYVLLRKLHSDEETSNGVHGILVSKHNSDGNVRPIQEGETVWIFTPSEWSHGAEGDRWIFLDRIELGTLCHE